MLNVRFVCWLMNMFVVRSWLQHRILEPDKHRMHLSVLEAILNFLTLPFSICVPPTVSFRFLLHLKAVIRCSWNNSRRLLLIWRMFQFLQTSAVRFGKNRLYVNINRMRFGSCCSRSFSCNRSPYTSLSTFPNCPSTSSKIFLSVLMNNGPNLCGLSRFSLFKVFGYMVCCFLTILVALSWC